MTNEELLSKLGEALNDHAANRGEPHLNIAEQVRSATTLFSAYVEFTKMIFSNLFLINAGSAVALITFLGKANEKAATTAIAPAATASKGPELVTLVGAKHAILCFALGALFAVAATACVALQESINSGTREKAAAKALAANPAADVVEAKELGYACGWFGIGFLALSAVLFCGGCFFAVFST